MPFGFCLRFAELGAGPRSFGPMHSSIGSSMVPSSGELCFDVETALCQLMFMLFVCLMKAVVTVNPKDIAFQSFSVGNRFYLVLSN